MSEIPTPTPSAVRSASERLLDAPGISIDRMPMLHVVFDRMATQCSENLRQLSAAPAFFSVGGEADRRRARRLRQ
jgi:flagellar motor switch protein FliM